MRVGVRGGRFRRGRRFTMSELREVRARKVASV